MRKKDLKSKLLNLAMLMGLWLEKVFVVLQADPKAPCRTVPNYRYIPCVLK